MKLSNVVINTATFEGGEWVDTIPEMDDLKLQVRGIGNADWRRVASRLNAAVPREKKRGGVVDSDVQDKILSSCLLEACLLGWSGITDEAGTEVPYTKDKAKELLTNPDYRRFRDAVLYAASLVGDNTVTASQAVEKN